jgi:ADP-ribose pyrophosphatase YjhB (NUDIX family)
MHNYSMKAITENTYKEPPPWPPTMTVCSGAVVFHEQRILFVRQAEGHSLAGQWSIPWGFVDEGETPEDAALRETFEESGITAVVDGLLGIQNLRSQGWIGIIFACHVVGGKPRPDGVETDRAAYLSIEEILSFTEPFEPWCHWLALRVLSGKCCVISQQPETPYAPHKAFL